VSNVYVPSSLLGVSALARSGSHAIPNSQIIILPLLFTAGMTLVDSCDSIFMLHAYALPGRPDDGSSWWRGLTLFETRPDKTDESEDEKKARMLPMANQDKLLTVSVVLTVISIVVALLISIVRPPSLALCESRSLRDLCLISSL
jgi:high-affinity nickel-transport protein